MSVTPTTHQQNASGQIARSQPNKRHPLLNLTFQKCVAAFLSIRDMQSLGLTCFGQPEEMLRQDTAILPNVIMARYPVDNPMPGNVFLAYEQVYTARPLPEISSLNLLGFPEMSAKLPSILNATPFLKELSLEAAHRKTYDLLIAPENSLWVLLASSIIKPDFTKGTDDHGSTLVKITDNCLSSLQNHDLQSLELKHCMQFTGAGLNHLKKASLQSLKIERCKPFSDAGMAILPQFPLRNLRLAYCKAITSAGWTCLANLPHLKSLDLSGCDQLTDDDLLHLAKLPLKHLRLHGCTKITPIGLNNLKGLELESLCLDGCSGISAEAVTSFLKAKSTPPSLQKLRGVKRPFIS